MNIRREICKILPVLCAIALVWASFAHRPIIISTTSQTVDLSAYVLPDGTIPTICFGGQGDGKSTSYQGCEYCTLANAIIFPQAPQLFARVINTVRFVDPVCEKAPIPKSINLVGTPPTGPPIFST